MAGISHKAILEQTDAPKERYGEIEKTARATIEETVNFGTVFLKEEFLDSLIDVKITKAQYQKIPLPSKLSDNLLSLYYSRARFYRSIMLDSIMRRDRENLHEVHLCNEYYKVVSYLKICVGSLSDLDRESYESGRFLYFMLCRNAHKFKGYHPFSTENNKLEDILASIL